MLPHVFKDQLRRVFNIITTVEEVAALMAHFDKEETGLLNCRFFVAQFFKFGIDQRTRLRVSVLDNKKEKEEKEIEVLRLKEEELEKEARLAVNFGFTEIDFDSALTKFVFKCHSFEIRELGPFGWSSFTADALSFLDFKNTLKKRFDLKFTSLELGAIVMYCYPQAKSRGKMSCRLFINVFLNTKLSMARFKGLKDEIYLIKSYILELKDIYQGKLKRGSIDLGDAEAAAKPWRL
jgi:hypothetical protein